MIPNHRYLSGLELASMDSEVEWGDQPADKLIKRYFVKAIRDAHGLWQLIAFVEVEVVSIEDGEDDGYIEPGRETSRIPFPFESQLRKQLIKSWRANPPFHMA